MSDSASRENSGQRSRWPWFLVTGCLLIALIGLFRTLFKNGPTPPPDSADVPGQPSATGADAPRVSIAGRDRVSLGRSNSEPARTAEEIVAGKLVKFARSRREIVRGLARRHNVDVPDDVERFFDAVEAGNWDEIDTIYRSLAGDDTSVSTGSRSPNLRPLWPAIAESYGAVEQAHAWPAQKLLDYGEAVLGSLRPGMVYVGGTDPGRFIPTLLNATSEAERRIVLTQNGLADDGYRDYVNFLYGDRLATLAQDDFQRALQDYRADARARLLHDQQFPDEPRQIRPHENVSLNSNGEVVLADNAGRDAVFAINDRLLQTLLQKNPDLAFALEESFPLKSTYADAVLLGPIMELRAQHGENAFTAEGAAQSLDYWRATTQQMLSDPEASSSPETLKTWSKMAVGQANLFAERNYTAEAEQTYRLSMEMWPRNIESVSGLSDLLLRTGRAVDARRLVEDFARNNPDLSTALESLRPGIIVTTQPTPRP